MATQLDELQRTLGSLEAKVDLLLAEMKRSNVQTEAIEVRLRDLEVDLTRFKTLASVGAFILTTLTSLFSVIWPYVSK